MISIALYTETGTKYIAIFESGNLKDPYKLLTVSEAERLLDSLEYSLSTKLSVKDISFIKK